MNRNIRTDLAMETQEVLSKNLGGGQIPGVESTQENKDGMNITRVRITNAQGEQQMQKPIGNYITIEAPELSNRDPVLEEKAAKAIATELKALIGPTSQSQSVLVIGLGNWNITPDSLGPRSVDNTLVTRHLLEQMPGQIDQRVHSVAAISPGVLGITGLESFEVVSGVVEKLKPKCIIAIDALASRSTEKISTTYQLADTGINPGAGVGNMRKALSKETLGIPVIAMGVPLVVYASTIAHDAITLAADDVNNDKDASNNIEENKINGLIEKVVSGKFGDLVVTPKDIDIVVEDVSRVMGYALNLALHDNLSLEEVKTYMH